VSATHEYQCNSLGRALAIALGMRCYQVSIEHHNGGGKLLLRLRSVSIETSSAIVIFLSNAVLALATPRCPYGLLEILGGLGACVEKQHGCVFRTNHCT
jgi:hypothetical protein